MTDTMCANTAYIDTGYELIGRVNMVDDLSDNIVLNTSRIAALESRVYHLEDLLSELTNNRQLLIETNNSRLYITRSNIENMPADLEDVTLKELLEIISI
jgi:hypothetical protein